jgi:Holliday junction DNA helicase RuvA
MFAFLRGTIAEKGLNRIALDVAGVGYDLRVPDSTLRRLHVGEQTQLVTFCYIREDAFQIYGFLTEEEKLLFMALLGITHVGPKVALAILSALSPSALGQAVVNNDVTAFTKAPGVGKKMAQRIVLEMKAKLGQDAELEAILGEGPAQAIAEADDVIEALCSLGCTQAEATRAAVIARKQVGDDAPDEEVVRAALRSMARI